MLRIIEARDSEVTLLKLMVEKLKLQLLRRVRAEFGNSGEQWAALMPLIDGGDVVMAFRSKLASTQAPANDAQIDRRLPAHLPRDVQWAYGWTYQNSEHRTQALAGWQHHYNWHRPHSGIGGQPPMSRPSSSANNLLTLHSPGFAALS